MGIFHSMNKIFGYNTFVFLLRQSIALSLEGIHHSDNNGDWWLFSVQDLLFYIRVTIVIIFLFIGMIEVIL